MKYTKEKHLEHVAAFWDGKLQLLRIHGEGEWSRAHRAPASSEDADFYRIKPEPKLRQWKKTEFPRYAVFTQGTDGTEFYPVTLFENGVVFITGIESNGHWTFAELLHSGWRHSTDGGKTWHPCGVMEGAE